MEHLIEVYFYPNFNRKHTGHLKDILPNIQNGEWEAKKLNVSCFVGHPVVANH